MDVTARDNENEQRLLQSSHGSSALLPEIRKTMPTCRQIRLRLLMSGKSRADNWVYKITSPGTRA